LVENFIGVLIISLLVFLVLYFYLKNKKEGKDDYESLNDGSGGGHSA